MDGPEIKRPVTVEIDIPVTRRTRIHAVVDGTGEHVFHSRRLGQVFDFLLENEVLIFELLDEDTGFVVNLSRPPPTPPAEKA